MVYSKLASHEIGLFALHHDFWHLHLEPNSDWLKPRKSATDVLEEPSSLECSCRRGSVGDSA